METATLSFFFTLSFESGFRLKFSNIDEPFIFLGNEDDLQVNRNIWINENLADLAMICNKIEKKSILWKQKFFWVTLKLKFTKTRNWIFQKNFKYSYDFEPTPPIFNTKTEFRENSEQISETFFLIFVPFCVFWPRKTQCY